MSKKTHPLTTAFIGIICVVTATWSSTTYVMASKYDKDYDYFSQNDIRWYQSGCETTDTDTSSNTPAGSCKALGEARKAMWDAASDDDKQRLNATVHEENWGLAGYEGYMNQVIAKYNSDGSLSDWLKKGGQCDKFRGGHSDCTNKRSLSKADKTAISTVLAGSNVINFSVGNATGGSDVGAGKIMCVWKTTDTKTGAGRCLSNPKKPYGQGGDCSGFSSGSKDGECWGREGADSWAAAMEKTCSDSGETSDTGGTTGGSGGSASGPKSGYSDDDSDYAAIKKNANAPKIYSYFSDKNMDAMHISGIMGNMWQEHGFATSDTPGGLGFVQWTSGRRAGVIKYAKSVGKEMTDLDVQLDFLWAEIRSEGPAKKYANKNLDFDAFMKTKTVEEATKYFEEKFERAGKPNMDRRIKAAKIVWEIYGDGSGATETTDCPGGNGKATIVGDKAFPLVITQKDMKDPPPSSRWCWSATTNCHHDYYAADLMAPEDTEIVAFHGGKVTMANQDTTGAKCDTRSTLTIEDEKGVNYFYTHMKSNSLKVKKGQEVEAGDPVAVVGNDRDADCTPSHLHLQATIGPPPGCAGDSCNNTNRIDIQPDLAELFKSLPEK